MAIYWQNFSSVGRVLQCGRGAGNGGRWDAGGEEEEGRGGGHVRRHRGRGWTGDVACGGEDGGEHLWKDQIWHDIKNESGEMNKIMMNMPRNVTK